MSSEIDDASIIDDFIFMPPKGEAPLYSGYVLKNCKPSGIGVTYGDSDGSSYQIDTHIYWNPGTYNGSAMFFDLNNTKQTKTFDVNVTPKSGMNVIGGFYQTKVATIVDDWVGFAIDLGMPDSDISEIRWDWDDGNVDSYPFANLPQAKNPWHQYKSTRVFNGSVTVSTKKNNLKQMKLFSVVTANNPAKNNDISFIIQAAQFPTTKGKIVNFSINSLGNLTGVNVTHALWDMGNNDSINRIGSDALGLPYQYEKKGVYKVTCNVCLSNGRCYLAVPHIMVVNELHYP